jgi:nucleotidyltransferase/DNA polymerase involved in DNA repair
MDTTALVTEMERRVIAHVDMDAFYCQVRAFMAMHPAAAQHARALRLPQASRTQVVEQAEQS